MNNFILELDNFLSDEYCDKCINFFEKMIKMKLACHRPHHSHKVSDTAISTLDNMIFNEYAFDGYAPFVSEFVERFWNHAYSEYTKKFSVIATETATHYMRVLKIQRSLLGDGYHAWHYEASDQSVSNRLLTFIVYLNDVEVGGETEFLYYPIRVSPKKGKFIMFPGAFTHTHRGNQPLSGEKYILTGWLTF